MGSLLVVVEALVIFVVSIVILAVAYMVLNGGRGTGIGWLHWKGAVLMCVGALYLIFGFLLTRIPGAQ